MIHHGDCLEILPTLPADSIDSIVTDPPYGLSFMGKDWDHGIPGVAFWSEALRVAKPGAHLLAFGGTRTFHRLTCAIEDAGWEIRDCIMWVYGSGFPKSHDVSKAIDREAGAERKEKIGVSKGKGYSDQQKKNKEHGFREYKNGLPFESADRNIYAPATEAAQRWQGRGTALKPAWEPIIVARKPLAGTVAENVLAHGAGALNIDGCRVGDFQNTTPSGVDRRNAALAEAGYRPGTYQMGEKRPDTPPGRWPANLIHDGSDEVVGLFPETTSNTRQPNGGKIYGRNSLNESATCDTTVRGFQDSGSAARFFYCAKASKADRDEGLESRELKAYGDFAGTPEHGPKLNVRARNHHPTVKPTSLMRYLCRLVTPPGGTVLDPFCGSGSTGKAATLEGFGFIGIEREAEYAEIARARIAAAKPDMPLLVNA